MPLLDISISCIGYLNGPHLYREIRRESGIMRQDQGEVTLTAKYKNMCGSVYTLKKIMVGR